MTLASDKEYTDALAKLQKTSTVNGGCVFDHLTSVVAKILEQQPDNAVDLLETSLLKKKTAFTSPDVALAAAEALPLKAVGEATAQGELFKAPEPPVDPDTGTPVDVEPPNEYETEDQLSLAPLFESVGAGLGKTETVLAALAVKQLGEDPKLKLKTVRFFGKIFGTESDYYVFEAAEKEPEAEPEETAAEFGRPVSTIPSEVNSGTNALAYFVCSYLGGAFTKLPSVTPLQVSTAMGMKKFLTGDLSAEVSAYPPFPGVELNFLRAQIAIIAADTVLCPANFYSVAEGSELELQEAEDFTAPSYSEVSSWVHKSAAINSQGRCTWYIPPPPEEGEEAPPEPEPEAESILASAVDDGEVNGATAWTVVCSTSVAGMKHATYALRSNKFPGAFAVASGSQFANIYVGSGVSAVPISPPIPPTVQVEFAESEESPLAECDDAPEAPEPEPEEGEDAAAEEAS